MSSTNMACSRGRLFACMPSLYIQLLIIVFPLYALVTFSKWPPPPTSTPPLNFPPSPNSIGQPLRALPSSQLIPPTLNLLPPPDHLSHLPLDQQHLHSVSRCSVHCCQYILSAHGGSRPSPQFQRNWQIEFVQVNSLVLSGKKLNANHYIKASSAAQETTEKPWPEYGSGEEYEHHRSIIVRGQSRSSS